MGFYEQISRYYDCIFPAAADQLNFIKSAAGAPPKKVLDVACGTGSYSIELAKAGYEVTAVDLDGSMIDRTLQKAAGRGLTVDAFTCGMLELKSIPASFDCIFCIGNSIVHLNGLDEISGALRQMHEKLKDGGRLVVQIINYDRIIRLGVDELPVIRNDSAGLEFIRKYRYAEAENAIYFNTQLNVGEGSERTSYVNSIKLFPLMSDDLLRELLNSGFLKVELYGDFAGTPYGAESYMLVAKAVK